MKKYINPCAFVVLLAGFGLATGLAPASQQHQSVGKKAPDFKTVASDGKTYSLEDLAKDKVLVLYFIKQGCPINDNAVGLFNSIGEAYKDSDKVNFVGVYNGNPRRFELWNRKFNVPFKVLMDPDHKIINAYQAGRSPWIVKVGTDGNISKVMPGFSQPTLTDLNKQMAQAAGIEPASISFTGAPAQTRFG